MEKIFLALNSQKINYSLIKFAYYVAKLTGSKLTGVFLEMPLCETFYESEETCNKANKEKLPSETLSEKIQLKTEQGILFFQEACTKEKVRFEVFKNHSSPIEDIVFESRFADLLIIDVGSVLAKDNGNSFLERELLIKAECPVIIAPKFFNTVDEIVFCYDGSRSAVFAMKQFTYLFPQYSDKKVVVLEVNEEGVSTIYEKEKILGLLKGHYSQIGFLVLNGDPTIELFTYLLQKKDAFVVMGAYGRKVISNILGGSRADLVLRITDLPLFITHI